MAVSAGRVKSLTRCYSGVKSRRGKIERKVIAQKCAGALFEVMDLTGALKPFSSSKRPAIAIRIRHSVLDTRYEYCMQPQFRSCQKVHQLIQAQPPNELDYSIEAT